MSIKPTIYFFLIIATLFLGCYNNYPPVIAEEIKSEIETYKVNTGNYPETISGNLSDRDNKHLNISRGDFFYLADSTRTSYTLKVFDIFGMSDLYDSKRKAWIHSDK